MAGTLSYAAGCGAVSIPRCQWTPELMQARSAKGRAMRAGNSAAREAARQQVDAAKHALGERGEVWWPDGAPDYNRHMANNTPYAEWFAGLLEEAGQG